MAERDDLPEGRKRGWWRTTWFKVTAAIAGVGVLGATAAAEYVVSHRAEIVRKRVISTLSERFHAPVELDTLDISVMKGLVVEGIGLRIPYRTASGDLKPMITMQRFSFRTTISGLLHEPTHVSRIDADGIEIHIPPGSERGNFLGGLNDVPANAGKPARKAKVSFTANQLLCTNVKLLIETDKPGKDPLDFEIATLKFDHFDASDQMQYTAELTNPKPKGAIYAKGNFGPWMEDNPRQTAIDGDYTFQHADLNTIKGLGGILSSTGHFGGVLEKIAINGTTDIPDFSLDISDHPVPLHTEFHAFVDGTTGDTTLTQVQARLLHTNFTCSGTVMRVTGKGHDIALLIDMPGGRIEDLLQLGMKSQPPVMLAGVSLKAKLHIPPGPVRVAQKLELQGNLTEHDIRFTNPKVQDKMDSLSMRAQGRMQDVQQAGSDREAQVSSQLTTSFSLGGSMATFKSIEYDLPGARVLLDGVYAMDGNAFEFKGHVRTDATASQMVTGWKSMLLKPVDRFLKKNGAGLELPISISGTKNDVHFGLAFGSADETPQEMAAEMKARRAEKPRQNTSKTARP